VRIELRFAEDVAIVRLSGKFVAGSDGPFLRQKVADLIDAGSRKVILDFEDVPYIDSTGLGFLAGSQKVAQSAGASVVLVALNEHVKRVIDNVQLTQFFLVAENEAEALAKLNAAAPASPEPSPALTKATRGRKRAATPDAPGEQGS
jgi:anti-sigma B factor antagonist